MNHVFNILAWIWWKSSNIHTHTKKKYMNLHYASLILYSAACVAAMKKQNNNTFLYNKRVEKKESNTNKY